jgi:hypothetical protein
VDGFVWIVQIFWPLFRPGIKIFCHVDSLLVVSLLLVNGI